MPSERIGTVKVRNVNLDIHAYSHGQWILSLDGDSLASGPDFEKCKRDAAAALKKNDVEVAVEFKTDDGKTAVGRKISLKTRAALCRDEEGKAFEVSSYSTTYKADTPPEIFVRLDAAARAKKAAEREERDIQAQWGIDVPKEVTLAVQEALAALEPEA